MNFKELFSISFLFITATFNTGNDGVQRYGENYCVNIKRIIYLEVLVLFFSIFFVSVPHVCLID